MSEADVLRLLIRAILRTQRNRYLRRILVVPGEPIEKPIGERKTKPRKPKDQRTKIRGSPKLQSTRKIPSGKKLETRNNLRKS